MISTLYFIQFIAFYLWQSSSKQFNRKAKGSGEMQPLPNKKLMRSLGSMLFILSCIGFIYQWGILSGGCGFVIGLMAMGCLSVVIAPFQYIRLSGLLVLYACCVLLEILI